MTRSPAAVDAGLLDAIIVGGSYAGMSAALQLARARRQVLVIDTGEPRNRMATHSHGFLGHDGSPPADIVAAARRQLLAYPTVAWREDRAIEASQPQARRFAVRCQSGAQFQARCLVLAHGVVDELPVIDGLAERWGKDIFHCPYCHGYELERGRIGVLGGADGETGAQALLLSEWGRVTLFCERREGEALDPRLAPHGVAVERTPIRRISGRATVELTDGRSCELDAIFVPPASHLASPLAEQLGCELEDGGCITTDAAKQTTVEGVFACGDNARKAGSIALAVGEGALAGVAAHHALMDML